MSYREIQLVENLIRELEAEIQEDCTEFQEKVYGVPKNLQELFIGLFNDKYYKIERIAVKMKEKLSKLEHFIQNIEDVDKIDGFLKKTKEEFNWDLSLYNNVEACFELCNLEIDFRIEKLKQKELEKYFLAMVEDLNKD